VSGDKDDRGVRLDRWLWAARLYRTRSLSSRAIDGGKVHLNGTRAKRSKMVREGDRLEITRGIYEYHLVVNGLSDRRGPASEASELYEETPESVQARQALARQLKGVPKPVFRGKGRPTKKERRQIDRFRDMMDSD
jgi:ribosome-associated heat shock protein Hsp15